MKTLKIILIDKSPHRRIEMGKAFRGIAKNYWYDCQEQQVKKEREDRRGKFDKSTVTSFDLLLIHAREKELWQVVHSDHQVWYGGNGAHDNDIPQNALRIFRPITSSNFLTPGEAKEILKNMDNEVLGQSSALMNSNYNDHQRRKADFYEQLLDPEEMDWDNMQPGPAFNGFSTQWKSFKTEVKQLLLEKHQQNEKLSPFDSNYIKLLEAFINATT